MKKNKLYIIITISILVILFTASGTCLREAGIGPAGPGGYIGEELEQSRREIEVKEGFEEQEAELAHMEAEEERLAEIKQKTQSPVTYKGIIGNDDFFIDLIIDFEKKEVSGSLYNDWDISHLATEIKGNIDLVNLKINAECNGYFVNRETDTKEKAYMIISGYLSENLNNFSGTLEVEEFGEKAFTAQKK